MSATLLIDNYDSFTFNLAQLATEVSGSAPDVVRNDELPWAAIAARNYSRIIISPGPGTPKRTADLGLSLEALLHARVPILGVCLGHQAIGHVFGANVGLAREPVHGRLSPVLHDGRDLFEGLPSPFLAVRYHSLAVTQLPPELVALAWTEDGTLMGLRHRTRPLWGVQFHPESICTAHGAEILRRFYALSEIYIDDRHAPAALHLTDDTPPAAARRSTLKVFAERVTTRTHRSDIFAKLFGSSDTAFWLDTSTDHQSAARFSYMGDATGPHAEVVSYRVDTQMLTITSARGDSSVRKGSVFDYLETELAVRSAVRADEVPCDFQGGFVGYFGYELKAVLQGQAAHAASTADAAWIFADRIVAFDHETRDVWLLCVDDASGPCEANLEWLRITRDVLLDSEPAAAPRLRAAAHAGTLHDLRWRHDRASYMKLIRRSLELIRQGETYEVCLTNQLSGTIDVDPLVLYQHLRQVNPAPYSAFLRLGPVSILCSSPELFLTISDAGVVESKPIKGTAPRSSDATADALLARELASSVKNRSENLMIVDLLRNDLNRVCATGSVHVPKLFDVETYATVHQLVSTIKGQLQPRATVLDCVRSTFPGGSMTGAPKVRTMSILDDLEQGPRGIYSGSLGYLSVTGSAKLNIVIRTVVIAGRQLSIGTGGAIVALSTPAEEFAEIVLKVERLLAALRESGVRVDASALDESADGSPPGHDELLRIRGEIDDIDRQLARLLGDRFQRCLRVGELKDTYKIPVWQPNRVREVTENAARVALQCGMSPDFARKLWRMIIDEASRMELDRQSASQALSAPPRAVKDGSAEHAHG
jgi:para-aminobenzoate synthetase